MDSGIASIIVGALALCGTFVGAYFANKKSVALFSYRLEQLEKKMDLHNRVVERVYDLEEKTSVYDEKFKVVDHRIDDLEKKGA